jgi:hypothetical protein
MTTRFGKASAGEVTLKSSDQMADITGELIAVKNGSHFLRT